MQAPEYLPPFALQVGDVILWSYGDNKDEAKCPGFVTQVGDRTIQISAYSPGFVTAQTKDGVYHIGDPLRKKGNRHESGCWDYTPAFLLQKDLEQGLGNLFDTIKRLEARIEAQTTAINRIRKKATEPTEPIESMDAAPPIANPEAATAGASP